MRTPLCLLGAISAIVIAMSAASAAPGPTSPTGKSFFYGNGVQMTMCPDGTWTNNQGQKGHWKSLGGGRYKYGPLVNAMTVNSDGTFVELWKVGTDNEVQNTGRWSLAAGACP